jgi:streptogrisin C
MLVKKFASVVVLLTLCLWQIAGIRPSGATEGDSSSGPSGETSEYLATPLVCDTIARSQTITGVEEAPDPAAVEDLAVIAKQSGDSLDALMIQAVLDSELGDLRSDLAAKFESSFGGFWVDRVEASLVVSIAVVNDPSEVSKFICETFSRPDLVRMISVDTPYGSLEADLVSLSAWRESRGPRANPMNFTIDERANRLVLEAADSAVVGELTAARNSALNGSRIAVRVRPDIGGPSACTMSNCKPKLVGALSLSSCTSGFIARRQLTPTLTVYGALTAAHCSNSQSHAASSIGGVQYSQESGNVDAQMHNSNGSDFNWTTPALVLLGTDNFREIHSVRAASTDYIGRDVCKRGKTTGTTCGQLTDLGFAPHWIPNSMNFRRADYSQAGGDSGAPVYWSNDAVGIHSGGAADWGAYGSVTFIQNYLGIQILTK